MALRFPPWRQNQKRFFLLSKTCGKTRGAMRSTFEGTGTPLFAPFSGTITVFPRKASILAVQSHIFRSETKK
jgi:hypothetical protein